MELDGKRKRYTSILLSFTLHDTHFIELKLFSLLKYYSVGRYVSLRKQEFLNIIFFCVLSTAEFD